MKKIYTFGTSFTEGGGFEFDLKDNVADFYREIAKKEKLPLKKFWFSWPGQLQRKLGNSPKVVNLAKSGAGNDTMVRLVFDLVTDPDFDKSNSTLIIECAHSGRAEFFSNKINDHIIVNYHYRRVDELDKKDNFETHFIPPKNIKSIPTTHGMVFDYNANSEEDIKKNQEVVPQIPIMHSFFENFHSYDNWGNETDRHLQFLFDFLNYREIKYYIVEPHIFKKWNLNEWYKKEVLPNQIEFEYDGENWGRYGFVNFFAENAWSITRETDGKVNDGHMSLYGAKVVSDCIYKRLLKDNMI